MIALEIFEQLGYKLMEKNSSDDIQYTRRSNEIDIQRIGMVVTKYIEFYNASKEILICTTYEFTDGTTTKIDSGVLSFDELNAVNQQVRELNWKE